MSATVQAPEETGTGPSRSAGQRAIVFFDGICGFCNATVDLLMRCDRHGVLNFASLQGETAARLLPESDRQDLKTLVLVTESGRRYVRSAATVRIAWRLGGLWKVAAVLLWLIPLPLRDLGYRVVSHIRYRLFGTRETCRMPTDTERDRLLP